jgi:hypothetical protein
MRFIIFLIFLIIIYIPVHAEQLTNRDTIIVDKSKINVYDNSYILYDCLYTNVHYDYNYESILLGLGYQSSSEQFLNNVPFYEYKAGFVLSHYNGGIFDGLLFESNAGARLKWKFLNIQPYVGLGATSNKGDKETIFNCYMTVGLNCSFTIFHLDKKDLLFGVGLCKTFPFENFRKINSYFLADAFVINFFYALQGKEKVIN